MNPWAVVEATAPSTAGVGRARWRGRRPRALDEDAGRFRYDGGYERKRPDWTYEEG